jgi:hypothetical protein
MAKKRNVIVMVFGDRVVSYHATVRVTAPSKATDEEIVSVFVGGEPQPFLDWKTQEDDSITVSFDRDPQIVGEFNSENPADIVLEWNRHGDLEISE